MVQTPRSISLFPIPVQPAPVTLCQPYQLVIPIVVKPRLTIVKLMARVEFLLILVSILTMPISVFYPLIRSMIQPISIPTTPVDPMKLPLYLKTQIQTPSMMMIH